MNRGWKSDILFSGQTLLVSSDKKSENIVLRTEETLFIAILPVVHHLLQVLGVWATLWWRPLLPGNGICEGHSSSIIIRLGAAVPDAEQPGHSDVWGERPHQLEGTRLQPLESGDSGLPTWLVWKARCVSGLHVCSSCGRSPSALRLLSLLRGTR